MITHMSSSASNNFIIVATVVVPRVCVCLFVVFLPPRASRLRCTCSLRHRKLFYNYLGREKRPGQANHSGKLDMLYVTAIILN